MLNASPEVDWEKVLTTVSSCKPNIGDTFKPNDLSAVATRVAEYTDVLRQSAGVTDVILAYSLSELNMFHVLYKLTPEETRQEYAWMYEGMYLPIPESLGPLKDEVKNRINARHKASKLLHMPYTPGVSASLVYLGQAQIPSMLGVGLHGESLLNALNIEPRLRTSFPRMKFVMTLFENFRNN